MKNSANHPDTLPESQDENRVLFLLDDGWRCEKLDLLHYIQKRMDFDIATHDQATYEALKSEFTVYKLDTYKNTFRRIPYYIMKLCARESPTNNIRYRRRIRIHSYSAFFRVLYLFHLVLPALCIWKYRYNDTLEFLYRQSHCYDALLKRYGTFVFSPVHTVNKRIIYEALNRGLDVISWVYSWDNPMKDNEFVTAASRYFVWNVQCANSLCEFHPVTRDRVDIVGPVQFDYLINESEKSESRKPTSPEDRHVIYACSTAKRPHVEQEVNFIINISKILNEIDPEVRCVVRPYPYRDPGTTDVFDQLRDYENIDVLEFGKANDVMVVMDKQDLLDRQSQIQDSICMINHSSTIALEASFTDTPIIQLNFNYPHNHPRYFDMGEILKNNHLQLVMDFNVPNTVNSDAELRRALADILAGRTAPYMKYSETLQEFANPLQVENYKEVFFQALRRVLKEPKSSPPDVNNG